MWIILYIRFRAITFLIKCKKEIPIVPAIIKREIDDSAPSPLPLFNLYFFLMTRTPYIKNMMTWLNWTSNLPFVLSSSEFVSLSEITLCVVFLMRSRIGDFALAFSYYPREAANSVSLHPLSLSLSSSSRSLKIIFTDWPGISIPKLSLSTSCTSWSISA